MIPLSIEEELSGLLDTQVLMLLINTSIKHPASFYGLSVVHISRKLNGEKRISKEREALREVKEALIRLKRRNLAYYIRRHCNGNSRRGNSAKWFPSSRAVVQLAFMDQDLIKKLSPSFILNVVGSA